MLNRLAKANPSSNSVGFGSGRPHCCHVFKLAMKLVVLASSPASRIGVCCSSLFFTVVFITAGIVVVVIGRRR